MKPNSTETLYGIVNCDGNVFIDSFARTQKFAQQSHSEAMGKSWERCVSDPV